MIGFVIAMQDEAQALIDNCTVAAKESVYGTDVYTLSYQGTPLCLAVTGIGKVNAALGAQLLVSRYGATKLANFGLCGASDQGISVGDFIAVSSCVQCDFDISAVDNVVPGQLDGFESPFLPVNVPLLAEWERQGFATARLASGDTFAAGEDAATALREQFGCTLLEMELAAIAQFAVKAGIPFTSVKTISDVIGKDNAVCYNEKKAFCLQKMTERFPSILSVVLNEALWG